MNYENNTEQTRQLMAAVERSLEERYGSIAPEWAITLGMLASNLDLLSQCLDAIREDGIYCADLGKKNPLLATVKDLQNSIMAQAKHLGITPWAAQNLKSADIDDTEDFISSLTD